MNNIHFNDPKTLRHWEERIARFEGMEPKEVEVIDFLGGIYYETRWTKSGMGTTIKCPEYSTFLPDLFRVLAKIKAKGINSGINGMDSFWVAHIGIIQAKNSEPEKAIFQAICQYLRRYHPTVGEEQEEIERGSQ